MSQDKDAHCGPLAAARSGQGRSQEAARTLDEAVALARRCGDLYGLGNAINLQTFNEPDLAKSLQMLQQSLAAFDAAGYAERQGVITHNLGLAYFKLGLYRRARRLLLTADAVARATSAKGGAGNTRFMLAMAEHEIGNAEAARAYMQESIALHEAQRDARRSLYRPLGQGRIALAEGDAAIRRTPLW